MDIRKIESVCAVDTYCSYSEAAYRLCSSTSVISKHIAAVEEELGIRIFERAAKSRPVKLTPEGEKLIVHFREILTQYGEIVKEIAQIYDSQNTILSVGYVPRIGNFGETRIIAGFQLEKPNLVVTRHPCTAQNLVDKILDGTVDAAILPLLEGSDTPDSVYVKLNTPAVAITEIMHMSKLTIGLPENHVLASYREIPLDRLHLLRNETFLMSATDMQNEGDLSILTSKLGISGKPNIRYVDFSEQSLALELVNAGAGLLPQQCIVPRQLGNVCFVPVEGNSGSCITLYLIYRKDNPNKALSWFQNYIRKSVAQIYRQFPYVIIPPNP